MEKVNNAKSSAFDISVAGRGAEPDRYQEGYSLYSGILKTPIKEAGLPAQADGGAWWLRLLNYTNDIVFTTSIEGRISFMSDAGLALLGYTQEEVCRELGLAFVRRDYSRRAMRAFCRMLHYNTEGTARFEVPVIASSGKTLWFDVEVYLTGEQASGCAICGVARDITQRKKEEEQKQRGLERARLLAEEALEVQRDFLGNMSHEIRNPINSIVGMTNLLEETNLDPTQREYLDHIKHSSELLLALISDVLDFTKISEGKMEPCSELLDLQNLISRVARSTQYGLRDKDVIMELHIDPEIPAHLRGDATFLHQVLLNLLGNAAKFTGRGKITLEVCLQELRESAAVVVFRVSDTGTGIPAERLPGIFDRFSQLTPHGHRRSGGVGLGLPITKRLVELMGGSIEVESTVGKGSCFQFEVALEVEATPVQDCTDECPPAPKSYFPELRVLIVEDNPVNRIYLEQTLLKWGMRFDSVANGKEALDRLEQEPFDLCLLDIRMPVLDGLEMLSHLRRQEGHPNQHIPVIALTGAVSTKEREEALEAGVDQFLSKPFTPESLERVIREVWKPEKEVEELWDEAFTEECINPNLLEELYLGDKRHARIVFDLFLKNTPTELRKMEACLQEGDRAAFSDLLHKIKPNFRMVGLDELGELCQVLEEATESGEEYQILCSHFEVFKYQLGGAMKGLEHMINHLQEE